MTRKDETIGFRVSSDIKDSLQVIAKKEGRSLAQICEAFLRAGIESYKKQGAKSVSRFLVRRSESDPE